MSIVCTICQDLLSERPQVLADGEELFVIAVRCGHVFHRCCLGEWFSKNGGSADTGSCPCCKVQVLIEQGLRIYPSGDEDSSEVAMKLKLVKTLEEQNGHLRQELSQINMLLEDTGCQLENERVEHEILRFEFTKQESEIVALREELKVVNEILVNEKENAKHDKDMIQEELNALKLNFNNEREQFNATLDEFKNQARPKVENSEKSCQTDWRDAAILQARLVSYKSCLLHMQSEIRLLEEEYEKVSNLQPVPEEFECYIHEQNELAEKNKKDQPFTDTSDESLIEQDDSGDSMSMDG